MKKQKSERGQSLVELSISLLVLLYLLSGAVEFGLAFFQFVQLLYFRGLQFNLFNCGFVNNSFLSHREWMVLFIITLDI